jgi:para-nitrobenzyl esterase
MAFATNAGASSLAELRQLPAQKIVAATRAMAWPIVDGWVIPSDQYSLYVAKKFNDVPVLIGYNSDEGATFSRDRTPQDYIANVHKRYGSFADELLKDYPVGDGSTVPKSARDLARDATFGWHTWIWARLQANVGKSKVFYYQFDQHPDYPAGSPREDYGAPHGREVPYVFGHLEGQGETPTAADHVISDAMATYWTNFAKFGDPNGSNLPAWPAFSDKNPTLMYFALTPHTGPVPNAAGLKTLDAYFAWRRSPEGMRASAIEDAKPAATNATGPR